MTSGSGALTGPRPVDPGRPDLGAALAALWTDVVRAGGAVRFLPDAPVDDIRAAAEKIVAQVRDPDARLHMLVLDVGDELVGTAFLRGGAGAVTAHRATLELLMVSPRLQRAGLGGALHDAAIARAAELGYETLLVSTRGGTTLPQYYAARGWTPVGVFPRALKLGDELRDEHWLSRFIG